ncbi:DUF2812 domain-containing protein [uncultured Clostridium sp.]|uniref:DUF2812 domain-containing protein n=1 Tax=uncultured Clostridium sp. TaxID=59620 RepID=UPI0025EDF23F|nr:DUF2812 domain-containing protein [uncultured Clostridium sp.]
MAKKKYTFITFKEYETEAFAEYLEKMAARGWFLKNIRQNCIECFEKGEPKRLKFCVAVLPGGSEFESVESIEAQQFREYCEEGGWKLQYGGALWQIFYTEEEDTVPIETDPGIQLEIQRKVTLSWGRVLCELFIIGAWLWMLKSMLKNPGTQFSSYEQLITMFFYFLLILILAGQLLGPVIWYYRAGKTIDETGTLPHTSWKKVKRRNALYGLFILAALLLLAISQGRTGALPFIIEIFVMILFILYCGKVLEMVRETQETTKAGKVMIYIGATVIVGTLALIYITMQIISVFPNRSEEKRYERIAGFPVEFEELGGYTFEESWGEKSQQTIFCFYQREGGVRRDPSGKEQDLRMEYYKSPFPWIIRSTKKTYPINRGNVWNIEKKETWKDGDAEVVRYHYTLDRHDNDAEMTNAIEESWNSRERDLYIISNQTELLSLEFSTPTDRDTIKPAVESLKTPNTQ